MVMLDMLVYQRIELQYYQFAMIILVIPYHSDKGSLILILMKITLLVDGLEHAFFRTLRIIFPIDIHFFRWVGTPPSRQDRQGCYNNWIGEVAIL